MIPVKINKKEVEKALSDEQITAYNFSKLDTIESFLKFFNNIAKNIQMLFQ